MFATAHAMVRPAQSSRGKATTRTTPPVGVDGLSLEPQAVWSATSTFTTATIQASYACAPDFFNSLLGEGQGLHRRLPDVTLVNDNPPVTERSNGNALDRA